MRPAPRLARMGMLLCVALLAACVAGGSTSQRRASAGEAAQYNLQLGVSYLRQGDLQTAREKLEKAIEQDPQLATAYVALGLVFERLGDAAGAEKHYRRAVSTAPQDPDALNSLAIFLCLQKQQPDEALPYFERALAIPLSRTVSNKAMVYTNAGLCAKRIDLERAEQYLRAALNADPDFKEALLQMADVALSRGKHLQARAFVERYLADAAPSAGALWIGFRVEKALGATQAARDYADRLRRQFPAAPETRLLREQQDDAG